MSSEDEVLSEMDPEVDISENPVIQQQMQERMLQEFYRQQRRRSILLVVIAIAASIATIAICYYVFGQEAILLFLEETWPILLAPFAGWFLGFWAVKQLYRPSGRFVICLEPEVHSFRVVFIPDKMFRYFEQSGNNVLYHTPSGMPVYVAEHIDTVDGVIQYSWIHTLSSIEVMTREDAYKNWRTALEEVFRENLELMDHPYVIGLGYTRECLKNQLDVFAETLGLSGRDFSRDRSVSSPYPDVQEGDVQ